MKWKLDRVIAIESYTVTGKDTFGQEVKNWVTLIGSAYASVKYPDTSSDETVKGKQLLSFEKVMFETRYILINPTAKMRIVFEGAVHNVLYVTPIGRRMGWTWTCELRDNTDGTVL